MRQANHNNDNSKITNSCFILPRTWSSSYPRRTAMSGKYFLHKHHLTLTCLSQKLALNHRQFNVSCRWIYLSLWLVARGTWHAVCGFRNPLGGLNECNYKVCLRKKMYLSFPLFYLNSKPRDVENVCNLHAATIFLRTGFRERYFKSNTVVPARQQRF